MARINDRSRDYGIAGIALSVLFGISVFAMTTVLVTNQLKVAEKKQQVRNAQEAELRRKHAERQAADKKEAVQQIVTGRIVDKYRVPAHISYEVDKEFWVSEDENPYRITPTNHPAEFHIVRQAGEVFSDVLVSQAEFYSEKYRLGAPLYRMYQQGQIGRYGEVWIMGKPGAIE